MTPLVGGNYMTGNDIKAGDIVELLDEGVIQDSAKFKNDDGTPKQELVFTVKHNDEEKLYTMNYTSQKTLAPVWGRDTAKWVGKKLEVNPLRTNVGMSIEVNPAK